jgi:hypothetical protein
MKALEMWAPYAAWVEHAREMKRLKRAAELVLARWSHRGLAPSFETWRDRYAIERDHSIAGNKIILRWRNLLLSQLFTRWREQTVNKLKLKRSATKIVQRWMQVALAPAFTGWRQLCIIQEDQRGCITRWLSFAQEVADEITRRHLHCWATTARKQKESTFKTNKIVSRWSKMNIALPFRTWTDQFKESRLLQRAAKSVIGRWRCMAMSVPFRSWHEKVANQRRMEKAAARVVARWKLLGVSVPFATWQASVEERKRLQRAAVKVIQRWDQIAGGAGTHTPCCGSWSIHTLPWNLAAVPCTYPRTCGFFLKVFCFAVLLSLTHFSRTPSLCLTFPGPLPPF